MVGRAHLVALGVRELTLDSSGKIKSAIYEDADGDLIEQEADLFFLACGAVESARLLVCRRFRGAAFGHGRGRREAPRAALLGSLDLGRRSVREAGLGAMGRIEGTVDRRRCAFVWGMLRIRGGSCTVLKDGYNSPPLSRLEALTACHSRSFFPVKDRRPSA